MERYDWILLAISIALIGGGLVSALTSDRWSTAWWPDLW